ncbi:response regulator [bacterium]|nr:response regulator [bacterium]
MVKVIVADDHEMFAQGVVSMLSSSSELGKFETAGSGKKVVELMQKEPADIVLLDVDMPDLNGEDTVEILRKIWPKTKIVMLTMHDELSYIELFMKLQVDGYVLKNTYKDELITAIKTVLANKTYFGKSALEKLKAMNKKSDEAASTEETSMLDTLTERELDVLKLTAREHSVSQIAEHLCISENTVKTHRKNIFRKLNLKNSLAITRYAIENGLI